MDSIQPSSTHNNILAKTMAEQAQYNSNRKVRTTNISPDTFEKKRSFTKPTSNKLSIGAVVLASLALPILLVKKGGLFRLQKSESKYLYNFHEVKDKKLGNKKLFRSGELKHFSEENMRKAMESLRQKGITTIIDLRNPKSSGKEIELERKIAKEYGIKHTNIPMKSRRRATKDQERMLLQAFDNSDGGALIHCKVGKDRTGWAVSVVGAKRLGWSLNKTDSEMRNNGYNIMHRLHFADQHRAVLSLFNKEENPIIKFITKFYEKIIPISL